MRFCDKSMRIGKTVGKSMKIGRFCERSIKTEKRFCDKSMKGISDRKEEYVRESDKRNVYGKERDRWDE